MASEDLRNLSGGVIGCLTPKENVIEITADAFNTTGSALINLTVPAKKNVYAAFIKNLDDNLAGEDGAKVGLKIDTTEYLDATAISNVKGKCYSTVKTAPTYFGSKAEVKLIVEDAALTAGKLTIGVIYG